MTGSGNDENGTVRGDAAMENCDRNRETEGKSQDAGRYGNTGLIKIGGSIGTYRS